MAPGAAAMLLSFLALAALCLGGGLFELGRSNDLSAVILLSIGALALRALWKAMQVVEAGR